MPSKGIDCWSYLTNSTFSAYFTAPEESATQTALNQVNHDNLQVDSGNLPWYEFTGRFQWNALINGVMQEYRYDYISSWDGNIQSGDMTDQMSMSSIVTDDYTVCYGFYDAGPGLSGLTDQDQSWVYFSDNYQNWMEGLCTAYPQAADKPFYNFVLPGAHDAGMNTMATVNALLDDGYEAAIIAAIAVLYPPLAAVTAVELRNVILNAAITQKDTFTQMLNVGNRYFDFRPGYMYEPFKLFSDDLYHQHNFIPGASYSDFLTQLLNWLKDNPKEVVVVSCNTQGFASDGMNPTPQDLDAVLATVRQQTGVSEQDVAAGDSSDLAKSLNELWETNTRLIFLNQIDGETTKYDSYSDGYATLTPDPIIAALNGMNSTEQADYTYTVLQLQGTATEVTSVETLGGLVSASNTASPLMSTKALFDQATLQWVKQNINANLSNGYLTITLNDFIDNGTVSSAIYTTKQRMGLPV